MTRLSNIETRQKSTRLQTLLFAAFLGMATLMAATTVGTIATQVAHL